MNTKQIIAVSNFVKRQTPESSYSHYTGSWEGLRNMVEHEFAAGKAKPGYRDGVVLVPVPAEGFFSAVVTLDEHDILVGGFEARQPGEEPRKVVRVDPGAGHGKESAKHVDIVLYRHDVLAENNEQSSDAEWEIISVNARITDEEMPMDPDTLMYNHFELSGGTATGMSDSEFVAALRKSFTYWRDKAMVQGK